MPLGGKFSALVKEDAHTQQHEAYQEQNYAQYDCFHGTNTLLRLQI